MPVTGLAFNSNIVPPPRRDARGKLHYHWADPQRPARNNDPKWCVFLALHGLAAARGRWALLPPEQSSPRCACRYPGASTQPHIDINGLSASDHPLCLFLLLFGVGSHVRDCSRCCVCPGVPACGTKAGRGKGDWPESRFGTYA